MSHGKLINVTIHGENNGSDEDERKENISTKSKVQNVQSQIKQEPSEKSGQKEKEVEKFNDYSELRNEVISRMNKPDPSKKLGEKLLEGWIMLGESCPGNFMALFCS